MQERRRLILEYFTGKYNFMKGIVRISPSSGPHTEIEMDKNRSTTKQHDYIHHVTHILYVYVQWSHTIRWVVLDTSRKPKVAYIRISLEIPLNCP
jgi:hypothetical protein